MKVNISISGLLRKPQEKANFTLNLEKNATVKDAILKTGYKEDELIHMLCFVNDRPVSAKAQLKEKDKLFLTLLVGGG